MKKLFRVRVEDITLNKLYNCYLLLDNEDEVYSFLNSLKIKVININVDNFYFSSKKLNVDKMIVIVDNLYLLVNSGLTVLDALNFLVFNEEVDKFIKGVLFKSYFLLREGFDYNKAFDFYELDQYFIYTLNISKTEDSLRKNLSYLKDYYENVKLSKLSAEKSLIYPLMVLCSIMILLIFLNFLIIPQFSSMLGYEIKIELSTYLLIFMFITFSNGLIIFLSGKKNDIVWTKVPILKLLYKNYILYKFTRDINLLLKSGLTIYNSLELVLSNTKSQYILSRFLGASIEIESGKDLNEVFSKIKDIKEFSLTMSLSKWKGNYKEVFDFLEKFYYASFKNAVEKIMKMLEPTLIIFLSIIVLSLAFEIYSNVYLGGIGFEIS